MSFTNSSAAAAAFPAAAEGEIFDLLPGLDLPSVDTDQYQALVKVSVDACSEAMSKMVSEALTASEERLTVLFSAPPPPPAGDAPDQQQQGDKPEKTEYEKNRPVLASAYYRGVHNGGHDFMNLDHDTRIDKMGNIVKTVDEGSTQDLSNVDLRAHASKTNEFVRRKKSDWSKELRSKFGNKFHSMADLKGIKKATTREPLVKGLVTGMHHRLGQLVKKSEFKLPCSKDFAQCRSKDAFFLLCSTFIAEGTEMEPSAVATELAEICA
jgi:hypothetical protein